MPPQACAARRKEKGRTTVAESAVVRHSAVIFVRIAKECTHILFGSCCPSKAPTLIS